MSENYVLFSFGLMALATFSSRAFPFLFLRRYQHSACLRYIGQNLPPAVMLLLVLYCLKDLRLHPLKHGIPDLVSVAVVALIHIWRRNTFLSIALGTALYFYLKG